MSSTSSMKRRTPCSSRTSGNGPCRRRTPRAAAAAPRAPRGPSAAGSPRAARARGGRSRHGIQRAPRSSSDLRRAQRTRRGRRARPRRSEQLDSSARSAPRRNSHSLASGGKPGAFDQTTRVSRPTDSTSTLECRSSRCAQSRQLRQEHARVLRELARSPGSTAPRTPHALARGERVVALGEDLEQLGARHPERALRAFLVGESTRRRPP